MSNLLFLFLSTLTVISTSSFTSATHVDTLTYSNHSLKTHPLGVSIVLYRVGKAEKVDDLSNLEKQMDKLKSVNLYKITEDLGLIFLNTADPYGNEQTLPYKMLFGTYVSKTIGDRVVNGFISTTEVVKICDWIKKNKIESFEGFSKIYDKLSIDTKQALIDIGSEDKKALFDGYVKPLTEFYFEALKDKNSIVICGE
ncbi:MAG TPA: hypothetical protein VF622_08060 [Segetibacter sp.]|jgi:hypothetical protein